MQYGLFVWVYTVANSHNLLFRYCIPMDNDRPLLNLKYFDDVCPDKNGMSKFDIMNWD
jgi:hypothetical protein